MSSAHLFNSKEREENYELMEKTFATINGTISDLENVRSMIKEVTDEIDMKDYDDINMKLSFLSEGVFLTNKCLKECHQIIFDRAKFNQQLYDEANGNGFKKYSYHYVKPKQNYI